LRIFFYYLKLDTMTLSAKNKFETVNSGAINFFSLPRKCSVCIKINS
jgi:hypothetical protein